MDIVQALAVQALGEGSPFGAPDDVGPIPQCGSSPLSRPILPTSSAPPHGGWEAASFSLPCLASGSMSAKACTASSPRRKSPSPRPYLSTRPLHWALVVSVYCRKKTKRELVAETVSFHSSESLPLWSGTTALSPLDLSLTIQALSRKRRLGWPANHGREATLPL